MMDLEDLNARIAALSFYGLKEGAAAVLVWIGDVRILICPSWREGLRRVTVTAGSVEHRLGNCRDIRFILSECSGCIELWSRGSNPFDDASRCRVSMPSAADIDLEVVL